MESSLDNILVNMKLEGVHEVKSGEFDASRMRSDSGLVIRERMTASLPLLRNVIVVVLKLSSSGAGKGRRLTKSFVKNPLGNVGM